MEKSKKFTPEIASFSSLNLTFFSYSMTFSLNFSRFCRTIFLKNPIAQIGEKRFLMIPFDNDVIATLLGLPSKQRYNFLLRQINVGINSWVFKVKLGGKYIAVIKKYRSSNSIERLNAEVQFLNFLATILPNKVPKVLGSNFNEGLLAISYIPGRTRSRLSQKDLLQFIDFQKQIDFNKRSDEASKIGLAKDNVLCADNIGRQIQSRIACLKSMDLPFSVHDFLTNVYERKSSELIDAAFKKLNQNNLSPRDPLDQKFQTPIASDFGLHNVIEQPNGEFVFLDFEFSGWDNPCTLIANFVLHPGMQGKLEIRKLFEEELLKHYSYIPKLEFRYRALLPLFALRWSLIVLRRPLMNRQSAKIETIAGSNILEKKTAISTEFFGSSLGSHLVDSRGLVEANMCNNFVSACFIDL